MKKKLMMVTLLLAGLTMGACVDDKESASVTAVRDAKTEQLESVAAMNSAAAEAKQAMAAAEAALKLAEAEAQQAYAALEKANAEYAKKQAEWNELQKEQQTIENQKKQALLEEELAKLEVAKKTAEQTIANIKADMEKLQIAAQKNLLTAELAMKKAETALLNYEKQLADAKTQAEKDRIKAERIQLQGLVTTYETAIGKLNYLRSRLLLERSSLVTLERDLTSFKDWKEGSIATNNSEIAQLQIEIEALKKYTNYSEDFETLEKQYNELSSAYNASQDIYFAAKKAYFDYNVDLSASNALNDAVNKDVYYNYAWNWELVDENGNNYQKSDGSVINIDYSISSYIPWFARWTKPIIHTFEEGDVSIKSNYGEFGDSLYLEPYSPEDPRQFELALEAPLATYKQNLEDAKKAVAAYQAAYDGEATLGGYPYYVQAENADGTPKVDDQGRPVPSAIKCANLVDSVVIAKAKYDTATTDANKALFKSEYEAAIAAEKAGKEKLDEEIVKEADAQLEYDCFMKQVDMIRNYETYYAALEAKIAARNEQVVKDYAEKLTLWMDLQGKTLKKNMAEAEYSPVSYLYEDYYVAGNWHKGAETINSEIATKENRIAELQEQNADISTIEDQEELIALQKERIAAIEEQIKAYEVIANQAKADLDAAMAKNTAAE